VTGQRGSSSDAVSRSSRPAPAPPQFDMVLRGYDRIEVDEYIASILEENAALRRELDARASRPDTQPAPQPAAQPSPSSYDMDTPAEDSFGFRAEKLLRLAERESAEVRTRATRDAEAVEAAARRRSEEQLRAAEREADEIRSTATQESARLKKQAAQEVSRLGHLHRATKGEIRRLSQLLNAELERPDPEGLTAVDDAPSAAAQPEAGNPTSS
jgi:DivIVA domain-containing protein